MDKLKECPECAKKGHHNAMRFLTMTEKHPKFENVWVKVGCYVCEKCGYKTEKKIVEILY